MSDREHVLSGDCWCGPNVERVDGRFHIHEMTPYGPALELRENGTTVVTDLNQRNADQVLELVQRLARERRS